MLRHSSILHHFRNPSISFLHHHHARYVHKSTNRFLHLLPLLISSIPTIITSRHAHIIQASTTPLAHELIQGQLVRYSRAESLERQPPPTAVLVHGILGNRRNLASFAKRIVDSHPSWQVVLVDLRNHGESALYHPKSGPHSVSSAAMDVLALLRHLKLFPLVLIGHSFGGKVVMSMVQQFGNRLPRPVTTYVLDTLPGQVRVTGPDRRDHPSDLIAALQALKMPIASRSACVDSLLASGFSQDIARWVATNLRPIPPLESLSSLNSMDGSFEATDTNNPGYEWTFALDGIREMYLDYEAADLWPLVRNRPDGLSLHFVRAERSTWRWSGVDEAALRQAGASVHLLHDAGHWVHTDQPENLYRILAPSFGPSDEDRMRAVIDRQLVRGGKV